MVSKTFSTHPPRRVAIVHEWFINYAGSERVVEQMLNVFPHADLFGLVDFMPQNARGFIKDKVVKTSFLQKLPFSRTKFRNYLPLMPFAVEQFDLRGYDLIISSNHAVAKGVLTSPDQLHICMCYSPMRYAWDLQSNYLENAKLDEGVKSLIARYILHKTRLWDCLAANRVDAFIAISHFIARRIHKVYRRRSSVIYPPVDINGFELVHEKQNFYVTASRMVPYKNVPLIVRAFSRMPDKELVVIGDGDQFDEVKAAAGPNIRILGYQGTSTLKEYLQQAKAFVFAAEEDFGILPLEAQACGTPVIAFGKGGALETIRGLDEENPSGIFFEEQSVEEIIQAVNAFEDNIEKITPDACRLNAERFSVERFQMEFRNFASATWAEFSVSKDQCRGGNHSNLFPTEHK